MPGELLVIKGVTPLNGAQRLEYAGFVEMGRLFPRLLVATIASYGVAVCQEADCPGTALDRHPRLTTSLVPFRKAVKVSGYTGRVLLDLTITETGEARNPKIMSPARLDSEKAVTEQIHAWRFCPAVIFSRYKAVKAHFEIEITNRD